jgi:hypothetical protein
MELNISKEILVDLARRLEDFSDIRWYAGTN